jgi:predicted transcriptional regulator
VKQRTSHTVEVTDLVLSKVNIYPSVGSAARVLGVRQASISLYLKENRRNPFKNRYIFKLILG